MCNPQLSTGPIIVYSCQNSMPPQNNTSRSSENSLPSSSLNTTLQASFRASLLFWRHDRVLLSGGSNKSRYLILDTFWSGGWNERDSCDLQNVILVIQQSRCASLRSPSASWQLPNRMNALVQGADRELRSHVVCSLHAFVDRIPRTPAAPPPRPKGQHVMYMYVNDIHTR